MTPFTKGLVVGLGLGIIVGAVAALVLSGPPAANISPARIEELNRKIAAAEESRARADKQLEDFQKIAEQMAQSFQTLEKRFNDLAQTQPGDTAQPAPAAAP